MLVVAMHLAIGLTSIIAQDKTSVIVADTLSTQPLDSTSVDSNKVKAPTYHALLIGIDPVKLLYNLGDKTKFRLEAIAEYKWKGSSWLSAEYGMANATYAGQFIQYKSRSNGVAIGISKAFFEGKARKDIDNAFVGVSLGGSLATTTDASYIITDIWGTNSGVVPGQSKLVFFTGIAGGFRFKIAKHLILGWRAKGKVLINPKAFNSIAPIYLALYGKGDRLTMFDYNMYMCWQLH